MGGGFSKFRRFLCGRKFWYTSFELDLETDLGEEALKVGGAIEGCGVATARCREELFAGLLGGLALLADVNGDGNLCKISEIVCGCGGVALGVRWGGAFNQVSCVLVDFAVYGVKRNCRAVFGKHCQTPNHGVEFAEVPSPSGVFCK